MTLDGGEELVLGTATAEPMGAFGRTLELVGRDRIVAACEGA